MRKVVWKYLGNSYRYNHVYCHLAPHRVSQHPSSSPLLSSIGPSKRCVAPYNYLTPCYFLAASIQLNTSTKVEKPWALSSAPPPASARLRTSGQPAVLSHLVSARGQAVRTDAIVGALLGLVFGWCTFRWCVDSCISPSENDNIRISQGLIGVRRRPSYDCAQEHITHFVPTEAPHVFGLVRLESFRAVAARAPTCQDRQRATARQYASHLPTRIPATESPRLSSLLLLLTKERRTLAHNPTNALGNRAEVQHI